MMHPDIDFPEGMAALLARLAEPCHRECCRDAGRRPRDGVEVALAGGIDLRVDAPSLSRQPGLDALRQDLSQFLGRVMAVPGDPSVGYRVSFSPADAGSGLGDEDVDITVGPTGAAIRARGLAGLRRGVFLLEDEMLLRRAPILPLGRLQRRQAWRDRITRSPLAPYRWLSGWELDSPVDAYPEGYLQRLAHAGVNGLWVAALLRNLVPSRVLPEFGAPEPRLDRLRELIGRAARYGIRVFVFCIEPRGLPAGHPALRAHPEISSADGTLCTSVPRVREAFREMTARLFAEAPGLGGLINLFNGERYTTCWSKAGVAAQCPGCQRRTQAEGLAEDLDTFAAGIRDSAPEARLIAWTYMMDGAAQSLRSLPIDPMLEVMERSDPAIVWMGNFEHGGRKTVAGREVGVHEYALSYTGPSESFTRLAEAGRRLGRTVYAKLQIGASYEVSSVPHLPVPTVVYDKVAAGRSLGVAGAMLGWVPGGFPSWMHKAAGEAGVEPRPSRDAFLRRLSALAWGEAAAGVAGEAYERCAQAIDAYPIDNRVLYFSPITRAPAYLLNLEHEEGTAKPYNFGLTRSRREQPFENDPARWSGAFTTAEVIEAFRAVARGFSEASARFAEAVSGLALPEARDDLTLSRALAAQFAAAANAIAFYAARQALLEGPAEDHARHLDVMLAAVRDDLVQAGIAARCQAEHPFVGFHSEMLAYSYSPEALRRQERHLAQTLVTLERWRRDGVERAVLERTTEAARTPDRPDLIGD